MLQLRVSVVIANPKINKTAQWANLKAQASNAYPAGCDGILFLQMLKVAS